MIAKEHLTLQGVLSILSIKAVFPKGLRENILAIFPSPEGDPLQARSATRNE
jgi:hypothetical protein